MSGARFSPELFSFLRDLAAHNEREWFKANKDRYDHAVKEPALEFIEAFGPRLQSISSHFEANARVQGGSLFRIHRDTRFSKDKTPYKTNSGLHFRHERAKDAYSPGFYLHLEPRASFIGIGIWHPEAKVANQIRTHISENRGQWLAATRESPFSDSFTVEGDRLKRPPRGFDKEDLLIEDLKLKDFTAMARVTQKQVTSARFIDTFEQRCQEGAPLVRFLCQALDVAF